MRLSLGSRSYDLTGRALVMGTVRGAGSVAGAGRDGADIVEVGDAGALSGAGLAVICLAPADDRGLEAGLAAGVAMVRLGPGASGAAYAACARAGVTVVVVGAARAAAAEAAGVGPDRIVVEQGGAGPYPVLVDVTGSPCPVAATAVAVVKGARMIRTAEVRGARRTCDVLAAVMGAPA